MLCGVERGIKAHKCKGYYEANAMVGNSVIRCSLALSPVAETENNHRDHPRSPTVHEIACDCHFNSMRSSGAYMCR